MLIHQFPEVFALHLFLFLAEQLHVTCWRTSSKLFCRWACFSSTLTISQPLVVLNGFSSTAKHGRKDACVDLVHIADPRDVRAFQDVIRDATAVAFRGFILGRFFGYSGEIATSLRRLSRSFACASSLMRMWLIFAFSGSTYLSLLAV